LSQLADSWFETLGSDLGPGWAVIATGGYARGVLAPGSDIDAMLIHPPKASAAEVRDVAERLWYPMWDGGLKLGPGTHSLKTLQQLAVGDLDTATTILTVRCLAGDPAVAADVQQMAREQWRKRPYVWLGRLLDSGRERWTKLGDVASLLEPDLKDGRGGLRDHDMIRWALQVDRPEVTTALESPFEDLAGAADLLLSVRCELHRATGRMANVLLLQEQDRVAEAMGFADADTLMVNLAAAASSIEWATERFWRRIERLIRSGGRAPSRTVLSIGDGVVVSDDEAQAGRDADLDDPSFVFQYAATAAHAGYPLGVRSLRLLASRGAPPGQPWNERTLRGFLSLLGAGPHLVPTVEALERFDLFSRYLPEWRAVRALPQRNAFHTYTVDRHLLQTVANAAALVREVARPDLLLMGALLHDIGKGYPGDHTEVGMELVPTIAGRMGLDAEDAATVLALVEYHLLLPETATRRDLSDPQTALTVAAAVGDTGTLQLLRALTEADSLATGPSAWSAWKATLLDELVATVTRSLSDEPDDESSVPAPRRLEHLAVMVREDDALHVEHDADGDFDVLRIASRDRTGLFATIAGVLAVHSLDVVDAAATTAADGVAVDEFRILRRPGTEPDWERVERDLRGALAGEVDIDARIEQRLKTGTRIRRAQAAAPPRLEVLVSNDASASTTVVEVRAPDGLAVLYRLSHAVSGLGLDIRSAKVATLGHEVVDVFYVRDATSPSGKVPDGDVSRVDAALREALAN
jgi:[protein-PII] uridylyltransferase